MKQKIKQKIMVLGAGYVGNYIADRVKDHNIILCNKQEHAYDHPSTLHSMLSIEKPDYVINTCGYTGRPNVDACETNRAKCWELNVNLPVTMSTMCEALEIPFIHVSSGCIYTGYETWYTELDEPNFGLSSEESSWYSKTKHACEIALKNSNAYILRLRMPFCGDNHERNFFNKILKYNKLINYDNSMTCIEDFTDFLEQFINNIETRTGKFQAKPGIYNVCNPNPTNLDEITKIFKLNGISNPDWTFVPIEELNIVANRSNCVLNCAKIEQLGLGLPDVATSLEKCIANMCKTLLFKTGLSTLGINIK